MAVSLTRIMSAGTAAYAVYALGRPRHLGAALTADSQHQQAYDLLATTFGVRDLAISAAGLFGRSWYTRRTSMLIRIALDTADAGILSSRADGRTRRRNVASVTLGWATLNTLALLVDRRRGRA